MAKSPFSIDRLVQVANPYWAGGNAPNEAPNEIDTLERKQAAFLKHYWNDLCILLMTQIYSVHEKKTCGVPFVHE